MPRLCVIAKPIVSEVQILRADCLAVCRSRHVRSRMAGRLAQLRKPVVSGSESDGIDGERPFVKFCGLRRLERRSEACATG